MRVLINTDHITSGTEVAFATYMNMYDDSFAARYLRDGIEWRGTRSKKLEPERHYESDKYDIYYADVRDVEGLIETCRQLPQCRVVAAVDAQYNVVGEPLYVSDEMRENRVYFGSGTFRLPHNLAVRPAPFEPRVAEVRHAPRVAGHEFKPR